MIINDNNKNNNGNSNNCNSFVTYFVASLEITLCSHLVGRCISCSLPFALLMGLMPILCNVQTNFISLIALNCIQ